MHPPPPAGSPRFASSGPSVSAAGATWIVLLILLPLVCWIWLVAAARDMYGPMTGASAWMMTPRWDAQHLVLLWAMWAVMMTGMMLPSAYAMIALAGQAAGRGVGRGVYSRAAPLALGYLIIWGLFSLGATLLQRLLAGWLFLTPMMEASSRMVGAAFLCVAGVYQWTAWKRACLRHCQSPLAFLMRRSRSGPWGSIRMGMEHGAYCVGCCWALMLLLFAGGVMNLTVIAALTLFVAFEKLAPIGVQSTGVSGALLVATAVWMAVAG